MTRPKDGSGRTLATMVDSMEQRYDIRRYRRFVFQALESSVH